MLRREQRMVEAETELWKAIDLSPNAFDANHCLGVYYNDLGLPELAHRHYAKALEADPGNHDSRFAQACAYLSQGRWVEGFEGYEVRLDDRSFGFQMWNGNPLGGTRLLLHAEQGLGDAIMFHRFALEAFKRPGVLVGTDYVAHPAIAQLIGAQRAGIVLSDAPRVHIPSMSLPRLLGITEISGKPYILPPTPKLGLSWPAGTKHKIGLVWKAKSGKAVMKVDERLHGGSKSMPLATMLELARIRGAQLYALQHGCDDIAALEAGHIVTDLGDRINDFTDLACFIAEMDVIVSVDTAPAHLAGAMGKPVVVCLHNRGAWHWGTGDRSPWYDSARIVSQDTYGTWPIDRIVAEVEKCLARG
jgi:tetratricopeptide (TPR) repeat protein